LDDAPISAQQRAAWAKYRSDLRDTDGHHPEKHPDYPYNIVWPEKPE